MTVIAAIARDGGVIMAADTATNYAGTYVDGATKIRRVALGDEQALLAASGDGALLPIAQRALATVTPPPRGDVQAWLDDLAATVSTAAADAQPPRIENNFIDGALLLGWRGHLHYLFTHQAARVTDGIAALGSGCDVSLGVMHTALDHGATPETAVRAAVKLACRFCEGCAVGPNGPVVEQLTAEV